MKTATTKSRMMMTMISEFSRVDDRARLCPLVSTELRIFDISRLSLNCVENSAPYKHSTFIQ